MSNPGSPSLHNLAHVLMLMMIVGLVSLYLQLTIKYEDLARSCSNLHRPAKEAVQLEDYCTGSLLHNQHGDCCILNGDASTATTLLTQKASQLASEADRYSQTRILGTDKQLLVSISESSFLSKQTAYETSEQLKVDEFGRTEKSDVDEVATEIPTGVVSPLDVSPVQFTHAEEPNLSELQGKPEEVQSSYIEAFLFEPTSTVGQRLWKRSNAYSLYDNDDDDKSLSEDDVTTESASEESKVAGLGSSATLFSQISLSIPQTSRDFLRTAQEASGNGQQHFSKTYQSSHRHADVLDMGSVLSTDNMATDNKNTCQNCDSAVTDSHSRFHIQPVPAETLDHSTAEDSYSEVNDEDEVSSVTMQADSDAKQTLIQEGTSAWCDSSNSGYTCQFENLCYKTAEGDFIFLKGKHSVLEKLPSNSQLDAEDLFSISLSTVAEHNTMKFTPVFIPASGLGRFPTVAIIQGTSFILQRFKPDNVMHVLHDDVLPLYHSLHSLGLIHGRQKPNVTILFTDHFDAGEYNSLYKALSVVPPVSLHKLNHTADVICFDRAYLGLTNKTLWYQYGFFQMQGPLDVTVPDLLLNIRRAATYLASHLYHSCIFCTKGNYLILLSRKDNRRIINEGELMLSIARATKFKVLSMSVETHSLEEIISAVTNSRGIIGMHGSLLSFLIFLPPGSCVIELFPYAVNPFNYTPFKTVCDLPGSEVIYKSWSNKNKVKSVPHPDWDPKLGGISHLPAEVQNGIIKQSEVPGHLCCEDPSWLYHIYQDTEVDVVEVTVLVTTALTEARELQVHSRVGLVPDIPLSPGPVRDLVCKSVNLSVAEAGLSRHYLLGWQLPWNVEFLDYVSLEFQLVISEHGDDSSIHVDLPSDVMLYSLEPAIPEPTPLYNVWVRATIDKRLSGPYMYVACKHNV
ncbi:unnamed protein product [Candidula unifasciata]|uniref:Glycosyltransferase 61 catalytic domain-containing protein n=1 Tax=Candidula unifasciata TaxID=100452 RepID=A0A8S3YND0_9EUPU|nr:unnamed protein product [Candidula unifasciata]